MKRQGIVDSWPADVDDSAARRDWGHAPRFDFRSCFRDYLIPTIQKQLCKDVTFLHLPVHPSCRGNPDIGDRFEDRSIGTPFALSGIEPSRQAALRRLCKHSCLPVCHERP